MASEHQLERDLRKPRHSHPFTRDELQDRVTRAAANKAFDSSLKLRPLLPKFDAIKLIKDLDLPPIKQFFKDAFHSFKNRSSSAPCLLFENIPCKIYQIGGKHYMMQIPPGSETVVIKKRKTQDGRELTYRLEMCQQPKQARACGNGARASADRRPVDPPPVISLTIKHGNVDVTSSYEAAFMLFASLVHSRPIAQGRMAPTHVCPVITGVCVAGAAYLAKPSNAAYFIFPDLSIRHEGHYRLKFDLFEQTKRVGDMDEGITVTKMESSTFENPSPEHQHENMVNRAEIYSEPFQVYSAKKFPGLDPSTELSKVIADQGCRVRIRRDVRQRRAGEKQKGKGDDDHSQRGFSQSYQRAGSQDSQREPMAKSSHEQRRMSIDSQASQNYTATRQSSYVQSNLLSPALAGPARYGPDRTTPATPIMPNKAGSESYFGSSYSAQNYGPSQVQRGSAPYMATSPSSSISGLPTSLPSMANLLATPAEPSRPPGGLYNLPPPMQQKRAARSPETSSVALKDGARPMLAPSRTGSSAFSSFPTSSQAHESRMSLCYGDAIIAADDDDDDDESSSDEILDNPYTYRRATGDKVTYSNPMRRALQMWKDS